MIKISKLRYKTRFFCVCDYWPGKIWLNILVGISCWYPEVDYILLSICLFTYLLCCRLPVVFTDDVGSHLFEAVIKSSNEAHLFELGEKCFKRCILSLCIHPLGNYLAQTYLRCVKSPEHVCISYIYILFSKVNTTYPNKILCAIL